MMATSFAIMVSVFSMVIVGLLHQDNPGHHRWFERRCRSPLSPNHNRKTSNFNGFQIWLGYCCVSQPSGLSICRLGAFAGRVVTLPKSDQFTKSLRGVPFRFSSNPLPVMVTMTSPSLLYLSLIFNSRVTGLFNLVAIAQTFFF